MVVITDYIAFHIFRCCFIRHSILDLDKIIKMQSKSHNFMNTHLFWWYFPPTLGHINLHVILGIVAFDQQTSMRDFQMAKLLINRRNKLDRTFKNVATYFQDCFSWKFIPSCLCIYYFVYCWELNTDSLLCYPFINAWRVVFVGALGGLAHLLRVIN